MGKYDTPGMDGVGGQMRQDFKDAKRSKEEFERRYGVTPKPSKNGPMRKAAYKVADEMEKGLKGLFGL